MDDHDYRNDHDDDGDDSVVCDGEYYMDDYGHDDNRPCF